MTNQEIVHQIAALQCRGHGYYSDGLFPSQRIHGWFPYCREDNNIFFSTLIVYTLLDLRGDLDETSKSLIEEIVTAVRSAQPLYQHWKGEGSYNFWMTNPSRHFPGGWLLHRWDRFAIPDDTDDSCLVHLTNNFSEQQSLWLKKKIEGHYPRDREPSSLTPPEYRHLRAYPTFFGKQLAPEMDACVISNVLAFMRSRDYPWSQYDKDSLEFLQLVLNRKDYLLRPFEISPNYNHPLVILYHLTRLVSRFPHPQHRQLAENLKMHLHQYDHQHANFMELLLLNTCLLRMELEPHELLLPEDWPGQFNRFYFFQAGMLTAFQKVHWRKCTVHPFFHLKYRCEAFYWTLLLEYQVLSQRRYSKP